MTDKIFTKSMDEVSEIITKPMGYGLVTDRILVDGQSINYMYREEPDNKQDSGWRFFAGDEDEEYLDNETNIEIMNVNTIAHYDKSIIPFLEAPYGSAFGKNENGEFEEEELVTED
ncbi:DUF2185 domain-containing protein [Faecalibacter macacae]|uniref:DUF2185 domain-containing protein n=1 Tax=Faecalibacter macacae TaxID=1859289 RepID=A0A3L9MBK4_9FLAO|nr:DUF2185 domain-containing protein [Faecalibacter macacae]RLZ08644.1 DUF2185 domain-containing protein [Faecalibacter macacae]